MVEQRVFHLSFHSAVLRYGAESHIHLARREDRYFRTVAASPIFVSAKF